MPGVWWVFGVVVVVAALATYLTWLAARVDRLHARAAGASAALDGQLRRRAAYAAGLASRHAAQWGGRAADLHRTARLAAEAAPPDREVAENDLTRELREVRLAADDPDRDELTALGRRVALARQVHTDLVRDALAVRALRTVRLLRLARRHPRPVYFDIDDPAFEPAEPSGDVPTEPARL
jgi:hypothetical protein